MYRWNIKTPSKGDPEHSDMLFFKGYDDSLEHQLLVILLGEKNAENLKGKYRLSDFKKMEKHEFFLIPEISEEAATKLYAAFKLHEYISDVRVSSTDVLTVDEIGDLLFSKLSKKTEEHFVTALFDAEGKVLGINTHFIGNDSEVVSTPNAVLKEIYSDPLYKTANSFLIAHNHVVGTALPSTADRKVTFNFIKAGHYLGLPLIDHIIVSPDDWLSMRKIAKILWEKTKEWF